MFSKLSLSIIYGRHLDVAQRMLDFDFLSGRTPSVAGIIDRTLQAPSFAKLFFGSDEIRIPLYPSIVHIPENPHIDTFLNFASFRSATAVTLEALSSGKFQTIVIVAEWIPEREVREIIAYNSSHANIRIIWPATAGAIVWWTLRMGNSWGSLENIIQSGLYKKWSVGFVSRSGGMSNEMYRVLSMMTDWVHTGIALGWDRFLCSPFRDIVLDYERNPEIRLIVLLGEVGSRDELEVAELIKTGTVKKPVVAYVSGSFAETLRAEVQFWHAGAKANANEETASFKNNALRESGAFVPEGYADFGKLIWEVAQKHGLHPSPRLSSDETEQKQSFLQKRKSTRFTSTIADERWEELLYNGIPVSSFLSHGGLARVIGALWLKRELPEYALQYIDTVLILLADHGPAVSGATNTIITARAGKDIISSLVSWLLTIGPRFGGAIDGAARIWYNCVREEIHPEDLIEDMKHAWTPIPGIGHKVKSKFHPDKRCEILLGLAKTIPEHAHIDFAKSVEELTLEKKSNLILNVDGHIAASILDIFVSLGMTDGEIRSYIDAGIFNAFFILARSIGFIGHALDQKRLGESLYRTPWDEISYGE